MRKLSLFLSLFLFAFLVLMVFSKGTRADEPQKFIVSVDNIASFSITDSGVFNTPTGESSPGPLLPGHSYSWSFEAHPGDRLNFATMFVQSNDWFFAPDELGIPLYDEAGTAVSGDVTSYVKLWDAGTEGDEQPGEGLNQAPRQSGPNAGPADPTDTVRQVLSADLPAVNELVKVYVTPQGNGRFTLTIQNVSGNSSLPTPLAPGVSAVHSTPAPLFVNGQADWGVGLEALAEDGNPAALATYLDGRTGVTTPLAPVAWTVHQQPNQLFTVGQRASAGLESLAEDGSPAKLVAELGDSNSGAQAAPTGTDQAAPIFPPSGNYSFEITASPGDHLSLATMFVQSNDWFFSLNNIPLWNADGGLVSGDVSSAVKLYDAGSEVDQTPGFGSNQAPRQAGPNSGPSEGGVVTSVSGFNPANYVHITITPIN